MDDESPPSRKKLAGYDFWRETLKSSRFAVAPMVDQSELAWRLVSRRHKAELCYSPMYHASVFIRDTHYRKVALQTCPEDRPLIIQFCANDPEVLVKAAKMAEHCCDAIDLNLGCPQMIAKRGHYGAYLQDEWDLLQRMVSLCATELSVPITCKIRIFEDLDKTVRYAKMLEKAGCQLLTVHGRTKEQKGPHTGIADWTYIKAVKDALKIPVFANGNIQYLEDVHHCMKETGVDGVMSAEGNLHNPALFEGGDFAAWDLAKEYLELVQQYPCPKSFMRGHMFKIFHHVLLIHKDLRERLGTCKKAEDCLDWVQSIKDRCQDDVKRYEADPAAYKSSCKHKLPLPYWICQPYERPNPDLAEQRQKLEGKRNLSDPQLVPEPEAEPEVENKMSKNKQKKLRRNPTKKFMARQTKFEKCATCGNPKGLKCCFELCKSCCRSKVYKEKLECPGHKNLSKSKAEQPLKNADQLELRPDVNGFKEIDIKCNVQPTIEISNTDNECNQTAEIVEDKACCKDNAQIVMGEER